MANQKIEFKKKALERLITKRIQERIKVLELINTGTLLNSIKIEIDIRTGFDIQIIGAPYYIYLDNEHNITNYVLELPEVDRGVKNLIADTLVDIMF